MACPKTGAAICLCTPGKDSISDNQGHTYNIDQAGNAFEDGIAMIGGTDTAKMEFVNGEVYREATNNQWYTWDQNSWTLSLAPAGSFSVAGAGATAAPVKAVVTPPNAGGAWSQTYQAGIVPVAACLLPTGKLLVWSSDTAVDSFEGDIGKDKSNTMMAILDPSGGTTGAVDTGIAADMFCPGMTMLPNGQFLVDGGSSSSHTALYNPFTGPNGTWADATPLNIPRAYNTDVTLSNGQVFTIGGSWSGDPTQTKDGEVWSAATGWRLTPISGALVTGPDLDDQAQGYVEFGDDHQWLFAMPNGRVFDAGPSNQMWFFDPMAGTAQSAGTRGNDPYSVNGIAVMYDTGMIFKAGGAPGYSNAPEDPTAPISGIKATASAYVINLNGDYANAAAMPTVTQTANINHARAFADGVVLPDGEVFITGGQSQPHSFYDDNSVMTSELWNPKTMTSTDVASTPVPRNYHSTALLMPDGRVYVGGGGLGAPDPTANHPDFNFYSPPYLFNADGSAAVRPTISAAPTDYTLGGPLTVSASADTTSFSLVRFGSATHAVDTDQRRISVGIASNQNGNFVLSVPPDPGITVPGYWMLFALNAQGTPSVAAIMHIGATGVGALPEASVSLQDFQVNNNLLSKATTAGAIPDPTVPVAGSLLMQDQFNPNMIAGFGGSQGGGV